MGRMISQLFNNHRNIQFGIKDQQEVEVVYHSVSGDEIYKHNTYLETTDGDILLDDMDALMTFYDVVRKVAGEEVED